MNRIAQKFAEKKSAGRRVLIGYMTAGDPDMKTSERYMRTALKSGLDMLEIGVPFSEPTADGPTIQAAGQRALASGVNLKKILRMVKRLRRSFDAPMILFSYANPLFAYGYEKICADALAAGIDGLLVVDMPFEESGELRKYLRKYRLPLIQLIAPTTPEARARRLLKAADGFIYYILVKGVTGARDKFVTESRAHIASLRDRTQIPIAVGFGISNARQVRRAAAFADAVVVGSALIQAAHSGKLAGLVRAMSKACKVR